MIKVFVVSLCIVVAACSKSSDAPKPGSGTATPPSVTSAPAPAPDASIAPDASLVPDASPVADATATPDVPAAPTATSDDFDFDKLTHAEQVDFMKKQVVPRMKKLFQAFDAKEYATFGCKTCHGKDPQGSKYKMPNPELPKLDFAALKADKQEPKIAAFMTKTVKPEMAKLLHQPEYSDSNPDGFGCLECHEAKK